jgi:GH24 family phage-related lysozyme (muramidase)
LKKSETNMRKILLTSILSLFSSVRLGSSTPTADINFPLENAKKEQLAKVGSIGQIESAKNNLGGLDVRKKVKNAQELFQLEDAQQAHFLTSKNLVTWDSVLSMVKRRESLQLKPYICPGGHLSIGYGHLIVKGEDYLKNGVTEAQADSLLHSDMGYYRDWVEKTLKLKGNQLKAMTHFCYAFGTTKFLKSELYQKVKRKQPINEQIVKWVNINHKPNSSLLRQRNLELAWYNSK